MTTTIHGYTLGAPGTAQSPFSLEDLAALKATVLFTDEDVQALQMAGRVLEPQIEAVLDVWYGFVASHPHLVRSFAGADGQPDARYLGAVRLRFGQWIRDTCGAQYDRAWLDYQEEIARRHTRAKKNQTDGVASTSDHIHLRHVIAFIYPIVATIRPFLEKGGHAAADVERMHHAWFKALVLQVALWSRPYGDGESAR